MNRLRHNLASNTFEVFFDGSRVDTIGATGGSVANPDWKMYSFTVEASSAQSEILFREASSNGGGVLLDAVAVRASDQPVGSSGINDLAVGITAAVLSDSDVQSGSIVINGQVVDIDVDTDSLDEIVNAINSANTGVNASLVSTGTVTADNLDLYRIELSSADAGFTLADNCTGLFAAMGIQTGAYGEVYEATTPAVRKRRGYRAADALEKIQQSMQRIVQSDLTIGRASIQSSMTSIFEGLVDRYGSERLSALGLDMAGLEEGFLDISDQSRRRFSKSVYESERLLEKLLLETYDRNEEGLIDVMRETIESELGSGGVQTGSIINTFA
jgi:flagellar capping protein FliD